MVGGGLARIRIFQVRPTFVREFQLFHARDREMEHSTRGAIPLRNLLRDSREIISSEN